MSYVRKEKDSRIALAYFAISFLYLIVGGYGLIFVGQINKFGQNFGITETIQRELSLLRLVVVFLIITALLLVVFSICILRNKKWAYSIVKVNFWSCLLFMILFMAGNLYFIFGVSSMVKIEKEGLVGFRVSGIMMFFIYLIILMIVSFVKKQITLMNSNNEK